MTMMMDVQMSGDGYQEKLPSDSSPVIAVRVRR